MLNLLHYCCQVAVRRAVINAAVLMRPCVMDRTIEGAGVDVALLIRQRLADLGLEQKDLARAARVTESYVSQLLSRKRAPPAPNRTDIYDKMNAALKLPPGELTRLVDRQRREQLQRQLGDETAPLFREVRALLLAKCRPESVRHVRAAFERQAFGDLERFVTQRILDVVKRAARAELANADSLRTIAALGGRTLEETRVVVLEFLDTDVYHVSAQHCEAFLDPLIESWDIDLATFSLEVVLNHRVVPGGVTRFEVVERQADPPPEVEQGFSAFREDPALSGTATTAELEILRGLRFGGRRPTALYYYRELQSLRDPLHFR